MDDALTIASRQTWMALFLGVLIGWVLREVVVRLVSAEKRRVIAKHENERSA